MAIYFYSEDVDLPDFKDLKIEKWIVKVATLHSRIAADLNFIFCSDDYLLQVNKEYLNHDYYTDIITFNYCEENTISGDIFISLDRVSDNANQLKTEDTELFRVIIHGVLHLVGFEDHTDEEKSTMRAKEDEAINILFNA